MFVLAVMFICHFVADFLLQSREMGKTKSTNFLVLLEHLVIQFGVMFTVLCLVPPPLAIIGVLLALKLSGLNALVHGVIDWNIWRGYKWSVVQRLYQSRHLRPEENPLIDWEKYTMSSDMTVTKYWKYWDDHWFYATIGLDQLLHGLTMIVLVGWLV